MNFLKQVSVAIWLVAVLLVAYVHGNQGDCQRDYDIEYLNLAITWAPGACKARYTCKQNFKRSFTIHGLWPQKVGSNRNSKSTLLANCCTKKKFELSELRHLKSDLTNYWPTLIEGKDERFWEYEWAKHGTCSTRITAVGDTKNYFDFTLKQFRRFDLEKVLQNAGFYPSNTNRYKGTEVQQLISKHHGAQINIECWQRGKDATESHLIGIHYCYSPKLKPIDCPSLTSKKCLGPIKFSKM